MLPPDGLRGRVVSAIVSGRTDFGDALEDDVAVVVPVEAHGAKRWRVDVPARRGCVGAVADGMHVVAVEVTDWPASTRRVTSTPLTTACSSRTPDTTANAPADPPWSRAPRLLPAGQWISHAS